MYAAWGQRFGAIFLDGMFTALLAALAVAVVVGITGGFSAIVEGLATETAADDDSLIVAYFGFYGAWAVVGAVYHILLHGRRRGQTLGKMLLGIRVRDEWTDAPIGYGRAFGRWIMPAIFWNFLWIPGILDSLWPLWDSKRQTWHDKVVRSIVVRG